MKNIKYKGYIITEGMTIYAPYEFYLDDDDCEKLMIGHADSIEKCKQLIDEVLKN